MKSNTPPLNNYVIIKSIEGWAGDLSPKMDNDGQVSQLYSDPTHKPPFREEYD